MNFFAKIKRTGKASQDKRTNSFSLGPRQGKVCGEHRTVLMRESHSYETVATASRSSDRRLLFGFVIQRCLETPPPHAIGKCVEQSATFLPTDAGIGDAQAVDQFLTGKQILAAGF